MPIDNNKETVIIEPSIPTAPPVNNIGPSNFDLIIVTKSFNPLRFEPFIWVLWSCFILVPIFSIYILKIFYYSIVFKLSSGILSIK